MKTNSTEQNIEEILSSLNGLQRAEPSVSFEETLYAKIDSISRRVRDRLLLSAAASMMLMVLLNLWIIVTEEPQTSIAEQTAAMMWPVESEISLTNFIVE
jgi:hypothetical protein